MCDSQAQLVPPPLVSEFATSVGLTALQDPEEDFFQFVGDLCMLDVGDEDRAFQTSWGESSLPPCDGSPPAPAVERRKTRKASAEDRIQRIREKNRVAQARFRQKQKARKHPSVHMRESGVSSRNLRVQASQSFTTSVVMRRS